MRCFDLIFVEMNNRYNVDMAAKLYETILSNVNRNINNNKILWDMQQIRARNSTTHSMATEENIIMQALWTVYILGLNVLLASFSDASVTVLGIYYKLQSFFFIPLNALGVCIVPVLSFNYAINRKDRCKRVFWETVAVSAALRQTSVLYFRDFDAEYFSGAYSKRCVGLV